jgi:uncharacterized protein (TIGR03437 family)
LWWVPASSSQTIIATVAGSRFTFPPDGGLAINAPLGLVVAVAADGQGNIYVGDDSTNRVFRINSQGLLSTFAGNGVVGYAGDGGPAASASIVNPECLAFDSGGNLYVCDTGNFRIRKITPAGIISTFAGNGSQGYSGDGGPAVSASFGTSTRIAIDSSGNVYIADGDNHRIRRITTDGIIHTFAGNGANASSGDGGSALLASLKAPEGLAFDAAGNLYVADSAAQNVRRITSGGTISTFAGTGVAGETGDGGPASKAKLNQPYGLVLDQNSVLYIADSGGSTIRRIDPLLGTITTIAGGNQVGMAGDGGPASAASLYTPLDLAITQSGALLVADSNNLRARSIANGIISTIAGSGNYKYTGDSGPATNATLPAPSGVVVDSAGNVNICDSFANRVRTVNAFGIINLTAGTNATGFAGDGGSAIGASLADCDGIALDAARNLYVADTGNRRIRKITPAGIISTFAGNGTNAFAGDGGQAASASLSAPQGVAVDAQGNVYIADTGNNRIRKVSPSGVILTIAGTGVAGYAGDGGAAIAAQLSAPVRLTLDPSGNLYVSDSGNNVVRRVATSGIITTFAGNGTSGFSGDGGQATVASLNNPRGLAIDASGGLLIADAGNSRIRRVDSSGVISTIAGNGTASLSGDGRPPLDTGFAFAADVALDGAGNIYVADRNNGRVRRIQPTPASLVISDTGLTFTAAVDAAALSSHTIGILNGGAGTIGWSAIGSTLSGGANWLQLSSEQGTATSTSASLLTVTANPAGLAAGHYYGRIQIVSPGVTNSPRFVTVVLDILSAAQTTGPSVSPAGVVFTGTAGGANPAAQTLTVSKLHGASVTFTSSITYGQSNQWISATSGSGTVTVAKPAAITLTPNIASLAAGAYTAVFTLNFSDGSARSVPLALSMAPAGAAGSALRTHTAATCMPTKLVPVVTALGAGFSVSAGWPVSVEAQVVDDCGRNVSAGTVTAAFSNGDPPLGLTSVGSGAWSGTWEPRAAAASLVVTVTAQSAPPSSISGTAQVGGGVAANTEPPIVNSGGILNAASFSTGTSVAPGALVAVFGSNLSGATATAASLPLPTTLGGVQVAIGGILMPLLYAGPGQINAVVPFDLAAGTAQVIVVNGTTLSVPEPASVAAGGPGTFTLNGLGSGTAIVVALNPDGSAYLVGPAAPAHPGSAVVIYCTGIGGVQIAIDAGDATPLSPLAPANNEANVSVTMGGISAQVLFAGLVPTLSGLYQVNAVIPQGVTGDGVPLIITSSGAASAAVSLPIQ